MSMFHSYNNMSPGYIPNNSTEAHIHTYHELESEFPRTVYSAKGQKIGISWNHGEEFDLLLSANTPVLVAEDAIVYQEEELSPDVYTKGYSGLQAYNTYDCKSWTCVGCSSGLYIWKENKKIMAPDCGTKEIIFRVNSLDFSVSVQIYNFRWELVHQIDTRNANTVVLPVNKEFNDIITPGTYYCIVTRKDTRELQVVGKHTLIIL